MSRAQVSGRHSELEHSGGDFWVRDLGSQAGTFLNGRRLPANEKARVLPGDLLEFGVRDSTTHTFRVKACHVSVRQQLSQSPREDPQPEAQLAGAA
jgi:pSer/pThr/pTyr-binding forkhead associated (FHA) protein